MLRCTYVILVTILLLTVRKLLTIKRGHILNREVIFTSQILVLHTPPTIDINSKTLTGREAKLQGLDGNRRHVEIVFRDNGIGFESEYSEQIFEIFQRLNDKLEFPGTGIGLALCRKIVTNLKGKIFAEGIVGRGATFRIVLPVKQS